jgi:uncharacterized protein YjdB
MKQKLFFLMLTLFMLGVASVQAQVTIGADAPPHSSAVLDLQSTALGLKLPTIELGDVSVFQLLGTEDEADGIMIYNSSEETAGGSGKGIYVWEGKWIFAGKSAPVDVPVTRIKITSENYDTKVDADGALQLTATVEPATASNPSLIWSIVYNPATSAGRATIDQNGLITGVRAGNVVARATATDGSGVYVNFEFVVLATGVAESITVESTTGTTMEIGRSIQLETTVEPVNANQLVVWSVDEGSSSIATVNSSGLVTGLAVGNALIIATTAGEGTASGSFEVEVVDIVPVSTVTQTIGTGEYETYNFQGTVWMVENSREGNWSFDENPQIPGVPAYFYAPADKTSACPEGSGWYLPTQVQATNLKAYLDGAASGGEALLFTSPELLVGTYENGNWNNSGAMASWFLGDSTTYRLLLSNSQVWISNYGNVRYANVRCVKH